MGELKIILPHVLAAVNVSTVIALGTGYYFVRNGKRERHRTCMIAAIGLGIAFLVLYLSYHFGAGLAKFGGEGLIRPVYFSILIAHIIAATVAVPLVPLAVYRAVTGKYERHRRLAPWAWKVWMFVALSGIVVYAMTIHIWPYKGA